MSKEEAIILRSAEDTDRGFILNSWLTSYKESSFFAESIPKNIYYKFHHQIAEGILARQSSTIIVACPEEDQQLIYGYAVFEEIAGYDVFHYIYVKRTFNGFGISKALIKAAPFQVSRGAYASHMTHKGKKLIEKYGMTYCPYLVG